MPKLCLVPAAVVLVALAGCHRTRVDEIRYTAEPAGGMLSLTCLDSSTGKCYFAFTGEATPPTLTLKAGSWATVKNAPAGAGYCADAHPVSLQSCPRVNVSAKKQTVHRKASSDAAGS